MSSRQSGLSLVELMVAMVIGLVLVAGITQVFLASKRTYSYQQSLARIQENGRIALEFLSRDIRMAGYTGCASGSYTSITNTLNDPTSASYDFSTGVRGFDVAGTVPTDLASLNPAPLPDTDVLIVRGPVGDGVKVIKNNSSAQLFSGVTSTEVGGCPGEPATDKISGICQGDILMVADCTKARVFQTGNIQVASGELNITHPASGTPGNAQSSWGGASAPESEKFGADSEIIKMNTVFYYIGQGASGQPSLYQSIVPGVTNEILEGVENMQLLYGRDTTGDGVPESYLTASAVGSANWGQVVGVRVQLLMRSVENNVTDKVQPYSFNGTAVTPTDRRLRQIFISTVGLRSRIP